MEENTKWYHLSPKSLKRTSIVTIALGILFCIWFLYLLKNNFEYSGTNFTNNSLDITYKVACILGAIIGPIWALAAVFIYYTALKYQSDEIKKSQDASEIQSFENIFFNLLNHQSSITEKLKGTFSTCKDLKFTKLQFLGLDYFRISKQVLTVIYNSLNGNYKGSFSKVSLSEAKDEIYCNYPDYEHNHLFDQENTIQKIKIQNLTYSISEEMWNEYSMQNEYFKVKKSYELFFKVHHFEIGHYFRHFYNILKFIDTSKEQFKKKNIEFDHDKYANFIQAQMSSFELMLLFYNVLFFPKTKKLVLDYGILDNLAKEDLINESDYFDETGIKLKTRNELLFSNN